MKLAPVALVAALAGATVFPSRADMKIGMNLVPAGWGGWTEHGTGSDPFRGGRENITKYDPIWRTDFLEEIKPYCVIRFMDWCLVVNTGRSGKWADRAQPTDPKAWHPVAFEHMIDLCNRTSKDMWVNVVHTADEDYMKQLAALIKVKLNPSLKCYIEWSNETWNYAQSQGSFLGGIDGRAQGTVNYSVKLFSAFEGVFGTEMSARVIRVLPGWVDQGYTKNILTRLKATGKEADAYAIAPYVGGSIGGGASLSAMMADLKAVAKQCREDLAISEQYGVEMIAYEGGQHLVNGDAIAANSQPWMYDFYKAYNDTMAQYFRTFVHYAHAANPAGGMAWGVKDWIGQPIGEAHKYRGIVDWIKEHPYTSSVRNRRTEEVRTGRRTFPGAMFDLRGRAFARAVSAGAPASSLPGGTPGVFLCQAGGLPGKLFLTSR